MVQECFVLLCWTAVVLRQLQPQSAKKAVLKLVECQVSCYAFLTLNGQVAQHSTLLCYKLLQLYSTMFLQALYLNRLQSTPANKQNMLRVTDSLLAAKPELLPEYVEVAKGKGTTESIAQVTDCNTSLITTRSRYTCLTRHCILLLCRFTRAHVCCTALRHPAS